MNARVVIAFLLLFVAATAVHAADGHITLLTVSGDNEDTGGTADLYLTVQPGTGAIFIDSFPLTRVDTQSSVRYANKIACDMLQKDCSRYDFFYTIRANSAIVGGPSAGAAMTVLTVAVLDHKKIDQTTAMTGTINSGGIIGPVAGITAKVSGAKAAGMRRVLIPSLTTSDELGNTSNATAGNASAANITADNATVLHTGIIKELSQSDLDVIGVSNVDEALYIFTGKNYTRPLKSLVVPDMYTSNMREIADEICNRTGALEANVTAQRIPYNDTNNYSARIDASRDRYYSRASLCFSKNIELATLLVNASADKQALYRSLRIQTQALDLDVRNRSIDTISDLEAYAIVKERIVEAQHLLDAADSANPDAASLAYAQERLVSARSWSRFFGLPGEELHIDRLQLQRACLSKISEADERINYVRIYAPSITDESQRLLEEAQGYSANEPILCIFTASKAKAQANLLANALSVDRGGVDPLVEQKLAAANVLLQKQQEKGFFPILGYSYTQYAEDLRASNPFSALTFSEYALELSNLDIYFPHQDGIRIPQQVIDGFAIFGFGALFGASIIFFVMHVGKARPKRRR